MSDADETRGRGREASIEAILDAAEALFAARSFSAVSVRDIGEAAGVSHALVHRYLGSKEDVFRAVLSRHEAAIRQAAGDEEDLTAATRLMIREGLAHHRNYLRLIAHAALDDMSFDTTIRHFVASERLLDLARTRAEESGQAVDDVRTRFTVIACVALYLGWVSTGDWLLRVAQLQDVDTAIVERQVEDAILALLERIPSGGAEMREGTP